MKALLILLLTITTTFATAQDAPVKPLKTKKITAKSFGCTESYTVLRENPAVKQGPYKYKGWNARHIKGQYAENKPAGVWAYYGNNGQLDMQYDFSSNTYLQKNTVSAFCKELEVHTENKFVKDPTAQEPFFITGDGGIYSILGFSMRYPRDAINAGIEGAVLISAEITATGEIVNEHVVQSLSESTDKEALRVLQLVPDTWVPARVDGKPVRSRINIQVKYTLK